jgi:hypothetical protein
MLNRHEPETLGSSESLARNSSVSAGWTCHPEEFENTGVIFGAGMT